ncbi:hypothetical protein UT300010_18320 [Clostridium perfringens]|nr:hypothetical protein CPBEC2_13710 [Clostridium perfringens]BDA28838.1 hypothetical protein CPBEC3_19730 [Clostridium perfringens]BDA30015.1 hypothetical protein CPBEC4_01150 [Clostridium perfringens]BDA33329.1 hypothetical protein CPBEC5_03370 [Clostridium perfringens]BDC00852.1 hypothetical protein CP118TE_05610 [Clostridium perfringens E]
MYKIDPINITQINIINNLSFKPFNIFKSKNIMEYIKKIMYLAKYTANEYTDVIVKLTNTLLITARCIIENIIIVSAIQ